MNYNEDECWQCGTPITEDNLGTVGGDGYCTCVDCDDQVCDECGTDLDPDGYCNDAGCRFCGKTQEVAK